MKWNDWDQSEWWNFETAAEIESEPLPVDVLESFFCNWFSSLTVFLSKIVHFLIVTVVYCTLGAICFVFCIVFGEALNMVVCTRRAPSSDVHLVVNAPLAVIFNWLPKTWMEHETWTLCTRDYKDTLDANNASAVYSNWVTPIEFAFVSICSSLDTNVFIYN